MMDNPATVVFVCEHGAAKSVVAAAYFNRVAAEMGLDLHAIARGTHPDDDLSPQAIKGLAKDGLTPEESAPRRLAETDVKSALRVIAFCELPTEDDQQSKIQRWDDIPAVGENYEKARDAIVARIRQMLEHEGMD